MTTGHGAATRIETFPITKPARPLRRIFVRDLVLETEIGVWDHEHGRTQRVRINIDAWIHDPDTPRHDDLAEVVSYDDFINAARSICGGDHINLVETMAEQLAEACLIDERVHSVQIRIEKLDVFSDAVSVGVEIERLRA